MTGESEPDEVLSIRAERLVAGGAALGREDSGRVVLIDGALPGELVSARVTRRRRDVAFAVAEEVLEGVPGRQVPPCPHALGGCGGCDLQHASPGWQPALKADVVRDALARQAGLSDPPLVEGPPLPAGAARTTVRAAVADDRRAGLRRRRSHEIVELESCLVAHPLVEEVLVEGRFPAGSEVTIRCGAASGERLVVVRGGSGGEVEVPDGVVVLDAGRARSSGPAHIREEVAGRWWRVSANSFFQSRPDGAEALVEEVGRAVLGTPGIGEGHLVDLYAGVGLFAGTLRDRGWQGPITAVERAGSSVDDARHNLAADGVVVRRSPVERWKPVAAEAVVADPARDGLGRQGVDRITATGAAVVVLVSCDAAALGRDTALLAASGYEMASAVLVDLFPHTHHVEVVSRFCKAR